MKRRNEERVSRPAERLLASPGEAVFVVLSVTTHSQQNPLLALNKLGATSSVVNGLQCRGFDSRQGHHSSPLEIWSLQFATVAYSPLYNAQVRSAWGFTSHLRRATDAVRHVAYPTTFMALEGARSGDVSSRVTDRAKVFDIPRQMTQRLLLLNFPPGPRDCFPFPAALRHTGNSHQNTMAS